MYVQSLTLTGCFHTFAKRCQVHFQKSQISKLCWDTYSQLESKCKYCNISSLASGSAFFKWSIYICIKNRMLTTLSAKPQFWWTEHLQYLCLLSYCHTHWLLLHIMNIHRSWNLQWGKQTRPLSIPLFKGLINIFVENKLSDNMFFTALEWDFKAFTWDSNSQVSGRASEAGISCITPQREISISGWALAIWPWTDCHIPLGDVCLYGLMRKHDIAFLY